MASVIPAKSFEVKRGVVAVKGMSLSQGDEFLLMELNSKFENTLLFTPNQEEGVLEIRSTSPNHNAVHIAAELEESGVPWKNPQNLGFQTAKCSPRHLQYLKSLSRKANAVVRVQ